MPHAAMRRHRTSPLCMHQRTLHGRANENGRPQLRLDNNEVRTEATGEMRSEMRPKSKGHRSSVDRRILSGHPAIRRT